MTVKVEMVKGCQDTCGDQGQWGRRSSQPGVCDCLHPATGECGPGTHEILCVGGGGWGSHSGPAGHRGR